MKREYKLPVADKIDFCYNEQVVASGSHICTGTRSENTPLCRDNVVWSD